MSETKKPSSWPLIAGLASLVVLVFLLVYSKPHAPYQCEKQRVALHEAAHVVVAWFLPDGPLIHSARIWETPLPLCYEGRVDSVVMIDDESNDQRLRALIAAAKAGAVAEEFWMDARPEADVFVQDENLAHSVAFTLAERAAIHAPTGEPVTVMRDWELARAEETARLMLALHEQDVLKVAAALEKRETLSTEELAVILGPKPSQEP